MVKLTIMPLVLFVYLFVNKPATQQITITYNLILLITSDNRKDL